MPYKLPTHRQSAHKAQRQQADKDYDRNRGSASARGYGKRWQRVRKMFLSRSPVCVRCEREGRIVPATEVHHIKDRRIFSELAYSMDNLEALCKPCHSQQSMLDVGRTSG